MAKLIAEVHQARLEWDALPLEERIRRGSRNMHRTPGPYKPPRGPWPGGPFAAWACVEPHGPFAAWR
jgi:hypothetical protein